MIRLRPTIVGLALLLAGFGVASRAEASVISFTPTAITAQAGTSVTLQVMVDPSGVAQYTTRLALSFPPNLFEVTSFAFNPSWIALAQPGYDLIDNTHGELIKTGGYPKGFSSPTAFGTITLRAKASGQGVIALESQSFTLDGSNKSTLPSGPQVQVSVAQSSAPPAPPAPAVAPQKAAPPAGAATPPLESSPLFDLTSEPSQTNVAPGELFPIPIQLANFGGGKRVDVAVTYSIISSTGVELYTSTETVAVETTAHFIKTVQIPLDTPPGRYTAIISITYAGQKAPATTQFPFTVERRILGLYQSAFFLYGGISILVAILAALFGYSLIGRRRRERFAPLEYPNKPKGERIYYEIVSDTIAQMRQRAGDRALAVALHTKGLSVDEKTGRVLNITEDPAKVVAALVEGYERELGKQVSFSLRKDIRK